MDTTDTTSPVRKAMTGVTTFLAILTCPCHIPILLVLFSGTAAGAFLSENTGTAVVVLLVVFLVSLVTTFRLLDKSGNDRQQIAHGSPGSTSPVHAEHEERKAEEVVVVLPRVHDGGSLRR